MSDHTTPRVFALGLTLLAMPAVLAGACSATGSRNQLGDESEALDPGSNGTDSASGAGQGGGILTIDGDDGVTGGDPQTCAEAAASRSYIGCDFWPTVVANIVFSIFDYAVVVANAGTQTAEVSVSREGNPIATASIPPNSLQTIYLPWVPELKGSDGICGGVVSLDHSVRKNGGAYHLVSSVPVTVYQFNALEYAPQGGPPGKDWSVCPTYGCPTLLACFSYSNDASLLLPSTAMTGNYRITSQAGWPSEDMGAYFTITGTADATHVTVQLSPTAQVRAGEGVDATGPNGILKFVLDAGDAVELVGEPTSDLSGSQVYADKPVQVIAGMPCVKMPAEVSACDHTEESVFPMETLGRHYFVTRPTGPNGDAPGHIVRLYGNVHNTALTYPAGAPPGAPSVIHAGQVVDLGNVQSDFEIQGDHEFAVGTFMLSAAMVDPLHACPFQRGDPAQSQAIAVEQFRTTYIFLAPSDYDVSYVDVIQPAGTQVTLDGAPVGAPASAIGGSGYGVARVLLGPGNNGAHVLTATKPVGIQVMGYGSYTSYQYPGGLNLAAIAPPPAPPH